APAGAARDRRVRGLARAGRGRRAPLPRRAGGMVPAPRGAADRRLGRVRGGGRRGSPARVGIAHTGLLRVGGRRSVPDRGDQHHAVRDARLRGRRLRGCVQAAPEGIRGVGCRLARPSAHVPGHAAAADVAAAVRQRAVPDLHVARGGVRGAPGDRPGGRRVRGRAWPVHRPVRELALDFVTTTRAVLLDALGTLVELQPPAPRLQRLLRESGFDVTEQQAEAGFMAEIAYYLDHHLDGSDPERLERLRDRCAEEMRRALELPELDLAAARRAMLGSLEFTPFPDAIPALSELRERGLTVVIASNWDCSLPDWLRPAGILELVDGVVTS